MDGFFNDDYYQNTDEGLDKFHSVTFALGVLSIKYTLNAKGNILEFKKGKTVWVIEEYVREEYSTEHASYKVYELAVYKKGKRPELATKRTETDHNNFTARGYKEIVTFRKA